MAEQTNRTNDHTNQRRHDPTGFLTAVGRDDIAGVFQLITGRNNTSATAATPATHTGTSNERHQGDDADDEPWWVEVTPTDTTHGNGSKQRRIERE